MMKVSGLTLICAFRYALGKQDYVVNQVVNDILANWDEISLITKNQFVEEIQIYQKNYGGHNEYDMQWQQIIDKTKKLLIDKL